MLSYYKCRSSLENLFGTGFVKSAGFGCHWLGVRGAHYQALLIVGNANSQPMSPQNRTCPTQEQTQTDKNHKWFHNKFEQRKTDNE